MYAALFLQDKIFQNIGLPNFSFKFRKGWGVCKGWVGVLVIFTNLSITYLVVHLIVNWLLDIFSYACYVNLLVIIKSHDLWIYIKYLAQIIIIRIALSPRISP